MVRALFITANLLVTASGVLAAERVDFLRDIRPILSENCFQCHGNDEQQRKADLRLDLKEGAAAVLVAGKPQESELYLRITSTSPSKRMPLAKSGKKLSEKQIELLRKWIEQGASWSQHWAFVPPTRPAVPTVKEQRWVRNPIDAFILARLEREGLRPGREADRVTLLRRLSLDLIGLPPTVAEVDAFLADRSPDAYEKQLERLLASPHYGERWGRHWLDAARYADSDGYEKDKSRQVWAYRDWVVNALNRDLPYDRFIIEQIAGDLLNPSVVRGPLSVAEEEPLRTTDHGLRTDLSIATGFLRNSMVNEEGGVDPEQFRMEAMFDRMDAIGKGILGLTIQCAQCHNHKYDPLTQEEYYRMFAFLNNAHEANIAFYTPDEQKRRAQLFQQIREIEADLRHRHPDWRERLTRWEQDVRAKQPEWIVVRPAVEDISTGGQKYLPQEDGSFLALGYAPTKHKVKMSVRTDLPNITGFRLELLTDPNLPLGGPGRSIKGTAALTEFEVEAAAADAPDKVTKVKIATATADVELLEKPLDPIFHDKTDKKRVTGPVAFAIDGKPETAWGIDAGPGRRNQSRKAVFVVEKPIADTKGTILTFYLAQNHGGWNSDDNQNHNLGRFRLSITSTPDPAADPLPQSVRDTLPIPMDKRTPAQVAAVFSYWRTTVPEWKEANDRIEELWKKHPEGSSQLALQARETTRMTHLLERGNFLKPVRLVTPGVPAFLHALPASATPSATPDRLSFAKWLVDRKSPTTARSLVNRVWQAYFGTGLVGTSEDLGSQSETPSHTELLDWLAVELMEPLSQKSETRNPKSETNSKSEARNPQPVPWSLKHLHRLIVTSATYRQSSKVTPELSARDPQNRLLARGPRFRVEGESVRDIALAASGLLNPEMGGPSVFPPAPAFLFAPPASYGPKNWKESVGPDRYRRALYTFRYRSVPYPALAAFDVPNGDFACVRRARSNTPLQALTTLNEPLFLECARALALRTVREGGASDAERLDHAFRRCTSRKPTEQERVLLLALLSRQAERFASEGMNPWELAADDPKNPPELPAGVTPAQVAGWTAVCRVLLNLDETITKE